MTVTINGTGPGGAAMTTSLVEKAAAVDPTPSPQPPLVLQAGKSIKFSRPLALFSTPTPHDASGSDFTATVDWGDGSAPTTGTLVGGYEQSIPLMPTQFNPTSGPVTVFQVSGDHTYATAGTFTVKVTLADQLGHSSTASNSIEVEPGPLAINPTSPILVTADPTPKSSSPGQNSIDLGTLTDFLGTVAGRTDSVSVDWGDGSAPTPASLSPLPSADNTPTGPVAYDINGAHAYAAAGSYTVKITAHDNKGHSTEATATIQVSAGKLAVVVDPLTSPSGTAGAPMPVQTLAAIVAPVSADPPSDFTATIDWGDGSTPTSGSVAPVAGAGLISSPRARLQVSGGHTYTEPGLYQATITVHGVDGSTAQATTLVQVSLASASNSFALPTKPTFTAGLASAPTVLGTFSSGTGSTPANFTATVNWGDGSTTQPALIKIQPPTTPLLNLPGGFNVLGVHNYARAGSYTVTLTITGADGLPLVITSHATVAAPHTVAHPTPVVSPSAPSIVTGPLTPTILRHHLPDFAPTLARHPRPATHHNGAHPRVVKPARHTAAHHVANKRPHPAAARNHLIWPA